jgi:ribokinase
MTADVVVAGQLARDLVLVVDDVPEAGQSRRVRERREMLGGKGANQAVAVAQLGLRPALIAVAGDDEADSRLLEQAMRDGIDVSAVIIREGTATGLITDIVDAAGHWRYLEDLPPSVLLSERDVRTGARLFDGARWASVQLQQPAAAVLTAAVLARQAGYRVLLDGAPPDGADKEALLGAAGRSRTHCRPPWRQAGAELGPAQGATGPRVNARLSAVVPLLPSPRSR